MKKIVEKTKRQYLSRLDRVEARKKQGWKEVGKEKNRKQLSGEDEMILMEK